VHLYKVLIARRCRMQDKTLDRILKH